MILRVKYTETLEKNVLPGPTGQKLNSNKGILGSMMKLNEGKYEVTCYTQDENSFSFLK